MDHYCIPQNIPMNMPCLWLNYQPQPRSQASLIQLRHQVGFALQLSLLPVETTGTVIHGGITRDSIKTLP